MRLHIGCLIVLFLSLAPPLPAQVGGSGTTDFIPIWTDSTTLGNSVLFQTGGEVGIGTISPTATLTVTGANGVGAASAPTALQVTGGTGGYAIGARGGQIILTGGLGGGRVGPFGGGPITIAGGNGGTPSAVSGRPGGAIQLTGGSGARGNGFGTSGGTGGSITILAGNGGANPFGSGASGGSITLQAGAAGGIPGVAGDVIITGGRVGIGTAKPANTLEVVAGGTTLADAWTTRSSLRFKTNIQPLEGALEKIVHLQGVSYVRKSDGKHEIGVVAEDVAKIVPEVVSRDPETYEAQGVDYSRLAALLIEAVKSQQVAIRSQETEIKQLKAQIEQLTSNPSGQ